jgi:hypothetical protein
MDNAWYGIKPSTVAAGLARGGLRDTEYPPCVRSSTASNGTLAPHCPKTHLRVKRSHPDAQRAR